MIFMSQITQITQWALYGENFQMIKNYIFPCILHGFGQKFEKFVCTLYSVHSVHRQIKES